MCCSAVPQAGARCLRVSPHNQASATQFVRIMPAPNATQRIALERAEELFERRGIAEIREIEKATLKQIADKKRKLREVVGESYHDVITSADAIVDMEVSCRKISENVAQLKKDFSSQGLNLCPPAKISPLRDEASGLGKGLKLDQLHAVGSRVKYLVDSPELIWSCLDSGDFLEASRRWLRSRIVYEVLQEKAPRGMLGRFPILQHLWPNVEKLRGQVSEQVCGIDGWMCRVKWSGFLVSLYNHQSRYTEVEC